MNRSLFIFVFRLDFENMTTVCTIQNLIHFSGTYGSDRIIYGLTGDRIGDVVRPLSIAHQGFREQDSERCGIRSGRFTRNSAEIPAAASGCLIFRVRDNLAEV
jgi:hypothetical protein